jgi:hypothetical protein
MVFTTRSSLLLVILLFISFFIQPIHKAMASEQTTDSDDESPSIIVEKPISDSQGSGQEAGETNTSDVSESLPHATQMDADQEDEGVSDEGGADEALDDVTSVENTSPVEADVPTEEGGSSSPLNDGSETPLSDEETQNGPEEVQQDDEPETTNNTAGGGGATGDTGTPQGTVDDFVDGTVIERGVTDLVGTVVNDAVTLARQLVTEENFYQFSRQSCVAVGDGTYHCTTKERGNINQDTTVFAKSGENGNMEIFMRTTKGELLQLTDNEYDDTSPDIDAASMRVVWQRMIDGRYQIISYDLRERKETQLTFSRTNSMEPKVSRSGIVWQEWDGNDWEIMYFDGKFMNQITDNDVQDVTPTIEDGYILWSVLGGLTPEAKVYTIATEQTMTITGHDGGAVANPRFVLVYDTKFDNGDVITQGFDPVTGLATPISAKPAEKPFDIPEPDPVGEIRALLQNKSNQKDAEVVTVPVADGDKDLDLQLATDDTGELLNLTDIELDDEDVEQAISSDEESDELILTEYDLVISDDSSSTNSVINKKYNLGTTTASSTQ